jgi:DNA/RNA endonuclease G (NUC1)
MNAAPQWQSFNDGNWRLIEEQVRRFAGSYVRPLTIYTGTHGITTLKVNNLNQARISFTDG